jgi:nucleotide-binding universal stress UspA family protein
VAVVRDSPPAGEGGDERVVVGYDGSDSSRAALHWAVAEARARHAVLELVHAWQPAFVGGDAFLPVPAESEAMAEVAQRLLDTAVAAEDTSGVPVELTQACNAPTPAILRAAERATLAVVGARGRGGFGGLLLGSVSDQVARHAPCPTVVVPHHR